MKIKYKNFNPNNSHNTLIPNDVFIFINLLYTIGIINKVKINADFMNKYHPEIIWNEYALGKGKNYDELKEYFKDCRKGR